MMENTKQFVFRLLFALGLFAGAVALGSCSGSSGGMFAGPIQSTEDLPGIIGFDQPPLREVSYTNDPDFPVLGNGFFLASPNAVDDGTGVVLPAPLGGLSYSIYQMGSLFYQDEVLSVTVNATVPTDADPGDFAYYVGVSYYKEGGWRFSGIQTTTGPNEVAFPVKKSCISPGQKTYIVVVTHDGAQVKLEDLTGHFNLVGRELDHLESEMPPGDIANTPVLLRFNAVDANGFKVFGFSQTANLTSNPLGMEVLSPPSFSEGYGKATVRFPSAGPYEIILGDADPVLDGVVGTVEVYQTQLPIYHLTIDRDILRALQADPYSDVYVAADVNLDGTDFLGIRVRFRGGSARDYPKKSWKIKLNKLEQYNDPQWGYERKTLNLNAAYIDQSLMRDKLSYDLAQDIGLLSPRARFVHYRVNDEYQGLYVEVENPRSDWLVSNGYNDLGSMYKARANTMTPLPTPADYVDVAFEKQLREAEPFDDLHSFITALNSWPGNDIYDELVQWQDTGAYVDYMAFNTVVSQSDALRKNYYLYHDFMGTGKWIVFPWDYDLSWGRNWSSSLGLFDPALEYDLPVDHGDYETYSLGNMLITRFLNDPTLRPQYFARLAELLDTHFSEAAMLARIDAYHALIGPDVLADPNRWHPGERPYSDYVEELREFVRQRRAYVTANLE